MGTVSTLLSIYPWLIPLFMGIIYVGLFVNAFLAWIRTDNYLSQNYPDKYPFRWYYGAGSITKDEIMELARKYPDWYSLKEWRWWWLGYRWRGFHKKKLPDELRNDTKFMEMISKTRRYVLYAILSFVAMLLYDILGVK